MSTFTGRAARAIAFILLPAATAAAQAPPAASPTDEWKITDNSFLVEEAFNQESGIVQHIFGFQRLAAGDWQFTFTQEWPAPGVRHQFSYTLPVQSLAGTSGMGDVLLNYRFQVLEEGTGRPAFAPRISAILPSGSSGAGAGTRGVQVNLPVSKRRGDVYFHGNGGFTWQRTTDGGTVTTPAAAASVIYRARDMLNLMLEAVVVGVRATPAAQSSPGAPSVTERVVATTVSPGVRGGWNLPGDRQVIVGVAAPITRSEGETNRAMFLYFSYEGPIRGLPRK